jgi:hypothetical protein
LISNRRLFGCVFDQPARSAMAVDIAQPVAERAIAALVLSSAP